MPSTRTPNFENLLAVLRGETPARPVLFEIYLSEGHYQRLAGYSVPDKHSLAHMKMVVDAFAAGGYDYTTVQPGNLHFRPEEEMDHETISLNEGFVITDRESMEAYRKMGRRDIQEKLEADFAARFQKPYELLRGVDQEEGHKIYRYSRFERA